MRAQAVDNAYVSPIKANPIPLPCAVLALSVAVCIGSAGTADAASLRGGLQAEAQQRETLEKLIEAIQQAAKDLDDKLDGQSCDAEHAFARPTRVRTATAPAPEHALTPASLHLREALLNLPPPTR